ncbi:MAG: hypothetical protein AAB664_02355, partial [Patescibacteria group bacterium]
MSHIEGAPGADAEHADWKAPEKPEPTVADAEARISGSVPEIKKPESDEERSRREGRARDMARQATMHGGIGTLGVPRNRDRIDRIS